MFYYKNFIQRQEQVNSVILMENNVNYRPSDLTKVQVFQLAVARLSARGFCIAAQCI